MTKRAGSPQEGAHLLDYVRIFLKRLWLIVVVFTLVVGVTVFGTYKATKMYRATARINIPQPNVMLGKLDPSSLIQATSNSQVYLNTQYRLLASRTIIEAMVDSKGLADWKEYKERKMSKSEIIRSIVGNVQVEPERDTTLVRVSVVSPDKALVSRLANALVDTFAEVQKSRAKSSIQKTADLVESRYMQYSYRIDEKQSKINALLEEHNTDRDSFIEQYNYAQTRLRSLQKQIDDLDLDLAQLEPRANQIIAARESKGAEALASLYTLPEIIGNADIQHLEAELSIKKRMLQGMEKELGKKNDRYVALSNDVQNSELVLAHMKDTVLTGLVQDYDAKKKTRANLESLRADVESKFRTLSSVKREYDAFQKDLAKDEVEYSRYHDMSDKLTTGSADGFDPVVVEERAQQPLAPFRPDKQLNIILGIVFGLLSGVGLAFFLEYLDDTVKTKEELQRITDVPLFGVIPNIAARRGDSSKRDLYAYQQPKSTISEAFRGIRTAISYSSQKRENRVYLVTSAGPKEGKTTVAINVATVMAYSGTKTVIVDADLRKPRVHKSFELENVRGLTNLIIGDASVEDVVQPTSIENLYVLPSGPIPPNPSELLGRERMIQILEELRGRYDRILLDTPPIGAVTDAAVLGRIVDSVILVVHAGKTRKKLIERGLEQLAQIDVDVSGIVLNNLKIGRKRYYPGYYHYYYYYSSYYGSDEPSKSVGKNKQKV